MRKRSNDRPVLYLPDSPNVGATALNGSTSDSEAIAADRARADELAMKVAVGDELSEYEKVAGQGVPHKST